MVAPPNGSSHWSAMNIWTFENVPIVWTVSPPPKLFVPPMGAYVPSQLCRARLPADTK